MTEDESRAIVAMGKELTKVGNLTLELRGVTQSLGGKLSQHRTDTNRCLDSLCDTAELLVVNLSMLMKHFGVVNSLEGHTIERPPHRRDSGREGAGDSDEPRST